MNKQRVFDHVVKHLLAQGVKSGDDSMCLYRSVVDGKDCKCAIGWLIPDDKYDPAFEGKAIAMVAAGKLFADASDTCAPMRDAIAEVWNDGNPLDANDIMFIDALRKVHDYDPVYNWPAMFRELAMENDLAFNA